MITTIFRRVAFGDTTPQFCPFDENGTAYCDKCMCAVYVDVIYQPTKIVCGLVSMELKPEPVPVHEETSV